MAQVTAEAKELVVPLEESQPDPEWLQTEIARLRKRKALSLEHVKRLHDWLDGKRKARQSCRIVGASRTGKSTACQVYWSHNKPQQEMGKKPIVPVIYIQPPQKCGPKELFQAIIEFLKYRATKGTVSDLRGRAFEVLQGCQVEMLIIDEADRLKPETFAEVRDIYDKLKIAVVLVGTDRLDAVLNRDEQVYNRFRACYRFGQLSSQDFERVVDFWEQKVLKLPVASNLTSQSMLKTLLAVTKRYIGPLDEVLREAAIRALTRGLKQIDQAVLKEVAEEYR